MDAPQGYYATLLRHFDDESKFSMSEVPLYLVPTFVLGGPIAFPRVCRGHRQEMEMSGRRRLGR